VPPTLFSGIQPVPYTAHGEEIPRHVVSPAYGYASLALVKCSSEGGPGPRYNMKEDPGSSIFSMLVVYGYYLCLLPLFSEPGDWKDQCGPLPPPLRPTWAKPPPSPLGYLLHPLQR
jgi:hypothetical protein